MVDSVSEKNDDAPPLALEDADSPGEKTRGAGRHSAREVALQVLYAIDLGASDVGWKEAQEGADSLADEDETPDASKAAALGQERGTVEIFDRIAENFEVHSSAVTFARELVGAVVVDMERIDILLGEHAKNWRVVRMAAVDRNVLRIGVFELRDTKTPVAVVIDEAVDLARRFGSDSSPSFVNGVLDAVARKVRAA